MNAPQIAQMRRAGMGALAARRANLERASARWGFIHVGFLLAGRGGAISCFVPYMFYNFEGFVKRFF